MLFCACRTAAEFSRSWAACSEGESWWKGVMELGVRGEFDFGAFVLAANMKGARVGAVGFVAPASAEELVATETAESLGNVVMIVAIPSINE